MSIEVYGIPLVELFFAVIPTFFYILAFIMDARPRQEARIRYIFLTDISECHNNEAYEVQIVDYH